ncbi:MAG: SDR family NAD(P)-dependent oxidoreductase [Acetobacterales bacterium]
MAAERTGMEPDFRLDGKVAVVTGASRGIGRAIAVALAAAGAELVLVARSAEGLEEACEDIRAAGGKATPLACDVTDRAQVRARIGGLPRIDVLFNNAGVNRPQPVLEVTDDALDLIVDVNVKACFVVAQTAARKMVEQGGGGSIVNTSSQLAKVGSAGRAVYCASKSAVDGITRSMAIELGPHGIRVNSVGPTFIETPMTRPYLEDPEFRAQVEAKIPLGRVGQVRDVAGAVVFLASPAASMITGINLLVDGGWTAA